jgi:hypothetical protein
VRFKFESDEFKNGKGKNEIHSKILRRSEREGKRWE